MRKWHGPSGVDERERAESSDFEWPDADLEIDDEAFARAIAEGRDEERDKELAA